MTAFYGVVVVVEQDIVEEAVADMVELEALAPEVKRATDAWAGCIAGTIPVADYRQLLVSAGFADPEIEIHQVTEVPEGGRIGSAHIPGGQAGLGLRPLRP